MVITCFYFLYPGKCVWYTYPGSILWLLTLTKARVLECDSVKRDTFRYDVSKLFSITKGVDNLRSFVSLSWIPFRFLFCRVEKGHWQWRFEAFLISFYCCLPGPPKMLMWPVRCRAAHSCFHRWVCFLELSGFFVCGGEIIWLKFAFRSCLFLPPPNKGGKGKKANFSFIANPL